MSFSVLFHLAQCPLVPSMLLQMAKFSSFLWVAFHYIYIWVVFRYTYSWDSAGKESACNAWDPQFISWVRKIPRRRDRLPTPVFLGFPGGLAGKDSACSVGDLGSIPRLEDPLEKGIYIISRAVSAYWLSVWHRELQKEFSVKRKGREHFHKEAEA